MINIEIVNWRSYVARGDIKNISWFKLSSDISKDKKLFGLSPGQKWVFVVILCEACKDNNGGAVSFTDECLLFLTGLNKKDLQATLQHFKTVGLIDIPEKFSSPIEQDAEKVLPVDNFCNTQTRLDQTTQDQTETREHYTAKTVIPRKRGPRREDHIYDLTDEELDLGRKWLEMALAEMPHKASDTKWNAAQFAEDIKAVGKAINYTHQQMLEVFNFIASSEFWRPNCCSPIAMLRAKEGGTRKIDTVITRMKSPHERKREMMSEVIKDPSRPVGSGGISLQRLMELQGVTPTKGHS